jgi:hypothetical protein
MAEMTPGTALRQLQQAHAGLKKARQLIRESRQDTRVVPAALNASWDNLVQAHRLMASIPLSAADEAVMTQQLSVQRYSTALLVRLRRLVRRDESEAEETEGFELDEDSDFD